jgi:hypothetical protein
MNGFNRLMDEVERWALDVASGVANGVEVVLEMVGAPLSPPSSSMFFGLGLACCGTRSNTKSRSTKLHSSANPQIATFGTRQSGSKAAPMKGS